MGRESGESSDKSSIFQTKQVLCIVAVLLTITSFVCAKPPPFMNFTNLGSPDILLDTLHRDVALTFYVWIEIQVPSFISLIWHPTCIFKMGFRRWCTLRVDFTLSKYSKFMCSFY